ncbi:Crp/Fnr family transcriptional regulator [Ancylobacter mangrovi]|uniref:Crp/Fnr family transcriptional regulator n=1 Tax=Ancylobacter mangrovi TaxID=2972472 RepID=UPI0021625584|nr:Crp/Fnr family transcriptional regulator [Ancylobacter mangrovi]MCS0505022.1 Crp/Fnr family transcriptional regulator [Ancylobacter mangrovi]
MSSLSNYILQRADLPLEEIEWFEAQAEHRLLTKGEVFCRVGQSDHELGFLESGILQVFTPGSDGRNIVLDFIFRGGMALALDAAVKGVPSEVGMQAVIPCAMWVWPYRLRQEAAARHPEWNTLALRMTEETFSRKQQRYLALRQRTARERFADMDKELPADWRLIPQHLLAAYLDITPQYFSRLKHEAERLDPPPTAPSE